MRKLVCNLISLYQNYVSPWLPPHCRYQPSCSAYMLEAVQVHGVRRGVLLGLSRLMRCHPFGRSGFDPVPTQLNKPPGDCSCG